MIRQIMSDKYHLKVYRVLLRSFLLRTNDTNDKNNFTKEMMKKVFTLELREVKTKLEINKKFDDSLNLKFR
jgi:hypothetical protein